MRTPARQRGHLQADNRPDKQRWLDEALSLPCDSVVDRDEAAEYLQPLLKRCNAKTKKTFWQWLRLQLARSEKTAEHLEWMRESFCPLEVKREKDGFQYIVNGGVALVAVGDESCPAVWRVPVEKLPWALSMYPVSLKRLPELESPEREQIRRLKRQVRREMPFLTAVQRKQFEAAIAELDAQDRRAFPPVPRYSLVKYINGQERSVHRDFVDAESDDEVVAVDGDFLNFGLAEVSVTVEPFLAEGVVGGRPIGPAVSSRVEIPNLQKVNSETAQRDFEEQMFQFKLTPHGDIDTRLKIQPNAKWRAGVFGAVTDCGTFDPLTPDDAIPRDYVGRKKAA